MLCNHTGGDPVGRNPWMTKVVGLDKLNWGWADRLVWDRRAPQLTFSLVYSNNLVLVLVPMMAWLKPRSVNSSHPWTGSGGKKEQTESREAVFRQGKKKWQRKCDDATWSLLNKRLRHVRVCIAQSFCHLSVAYPVYDSMWKYLLQSWVETDLKHNLKWKKAANIMTMRSRNKAAGLCGSTKKSDIFRYSEPLMYIIKGLFFKIYVSSCILLIIWWIKIWSFKKRLKN